MNERIKELAEQAWDDTAVSPDFGHPVSFAEKFAELIVLECIDLLWNESERLYAYSNECNEVRDSDEAQVVAEKCVDLITMIDQHFGFES